MTDKEIMNNRKLNTGKVIHFRIHEVTDTTKSDGDVNPTTNTQLFHSNHISLKVAPYQKDPPIKQAPPLSP